MRPQAIIAVLAGILAAVLLVVMLREPDPVAGPAAPVASGRTPAFHTFVSQAGRAAELQKSLDVLTSATAQSLGAHKDDIALLCDDEEVRKKVVSAYESRWRISKYEAAAFADIFMLVRAPEFVGPAREIFLHPEFEVRSKGPQVAATQAHASLAAPLLRFYRDLEREHPGEGTQTRLSILGAAAACGGNELPLILEAGLADSDANVRCCALDLLASQPIGGFREKLLTLKSAPELAVRLRALAALGSDAAAEFERELKLALVPEMGPERNFALACILARKLCGLLPQLAALRCAVPVGEESLLATTSALLGDESVLGEMRRVLVSAPPGRRDRWMAVQVLAAAGNTEDLLRITSVLEERRSGDAQAAAAGFNARGSPCSAEILALLFDGEISHPGQVSALVSANGDAILPLIARLLDATQDLSRAAFLIGMAGIVETRAARQLILDRHGQFPQLVEQQVRLLDLAARRRGVNP